MDSFDPLYRWPNLQALRDACRYWQEAASVLLSAPISPLSKRLMTLSKARCRLRAGESIKGVALTWYEGAVGAGALAEPVRRGNFGRGTECARSRRFETITSTNVPPSRNGAIAARSSLASDFGTNIRPQCGVRFPRFRGLDSDLEEYDL